MLDVSVIGEIVRNLPVTEELIRLTAIKTKLVYKIAILSDRITYFEKHVGNSGDNHRFSCEINSVKFWYCFITFRIQVLYMRWKVGAIILKYKFTYGFNR